MPPPVEEMSDNESGDIPFNDDAGSNGEQQSESEEEGEDVYVVETITEHQFNDDGTLMLLVKWKGYDKPEDHTWEPEAGLKEGANDVLAAYYKKLGGRPKKTAAKPGPKAGPGRKRKSIGDSKSTTPAPAAEPKKRRKSEPKQTETPEENNHSPNWVPKGKNWEDKVSNVDTIIRDPEDGGLYAFLLWTNGKRSRVSIESCYERCPLTMLTFYEQHLVFKDG
ncbi:hypothetical protein NUU61_003005 [Penicillium alfredii]|uniref:Chromo domain-containing protein n=1 Tax=Penicillium alfredii TaxID=1506179 RepID=A0A9W9KHG9_9EURO|nr:uncharacterized protein NUU61_003005 [Penicillium alfredii]KAJ5105658.1 hypothetical protein NUU61_003005 [Penicillium alfredii]